MKMKYPSFPDKGTDIIVHEHNYLPYETTNVRYYEDKKTYIKQNDVIRVLKVYCTNCLEKKNI